MARIVAEVATTIESLLVAEARRLGSAHAMGELARMCVRLGVERALDRRDLGLRDRALGELDALRRERRDAEAPPPRDDDDGTPRLF